MKEWDGTMMGREAHTCDSWSFGIVIGHGLGRTNGGSAPGRCSSHCTYKLPDLYVTWAFINIWICLSRFSVKFNVTVDLFLHYKRHPTTQIHLRFSHVPNFMLLKLKLPSTSSSHECIGNTSNELYVRAKFFWTVVTKLIDYS